MGALSCVPRVTWVRSWLFCSKPVVVSKALPAARGRGHLQPKKAMPEPSAAKADGSTGRRGIPGIRRELAVSHGSALDAWPGGAPSASNGGARSFTFKKTVAGSDPPQPARVTRAAVSRALEHHSERDSSDMDIDPTTDINGAPMPHQRTPRTAAPPAPAPCPPARPAAPPPPPPPPAEQEESRAAASTANRQVRWADGSAAPAPDPRLAMPVDELEGWDIGGSDDEQARPAPAPIQTRRIQPVVSNGRDPELEATMEKRSWVDFHPRRAERKKVAAAPVDNGPARPKKKGPLPLPTPAWKGVGTKAKKKGELEVEARPRANGVLLKLGRPEGAAAKSGRSDAVQRAKWEAEGWLLKLTTVDKLADKKREMMREKTNHEAEAREFYTTSGLEGIEKKGPQELLRENIHNFLTGLPGRMQEAKAKKDRAAMAQLAEDHEKKIAWLEKYKAYDELLTKIKCVAIQIKVVEGGLLGLKYRV
jgi:hypothetical protein